MTRTTLTQRFLFDFNRHAIMKLCLFTDKLSDSPEGQEDAANN
jgi:hypothetical protein